MAYVVVSQWAKNGKIVQLIMCVRVVALLPQQSLKTTFFTPLHWKKFLKMLILAFGANSAALFLGFQPTMRICSNLIYD